MGITCSRTLLGSYEELIHYCCRKTARSAAKNSIGQDACCIPTQEPKKVDSDCGTRRPALLDPGQNFRSQLDRDVALADVTTYEPCFTVNGSDTQTQENLLNEGESCGGCTDTAT